MTDFQTPKMFYYLTKSYHVYNGGPLNICDMLHENTFT